MSHHHDFIKGACIGGILGGVVGLLVAPKSGKALCKDIADGCHHINEKRCEFSKSIKDKTHSFLDLFEDHEEHSHRTFLIGTALGSVIAIVAAFLLTPHSGDKLRQSLGTTYDDIRKKAEKFISEVNVQKNHAIDELSDWKDSLITIVNKLSQSKGKQNSHLNDILDYATMGIQLFQQLKNRK